MRLILFSKCFGAGLIITIGVILIPVVIGIPITALGIRILNKAIHPTLPHIPPPQGRVMLYDEDYEDEPPIPWKVK